MHECKWWHKRFVTFKNYSALRELSWNYSSLSRVAVPSCRILMLANSVLIRIIPKRDSKYPKHRTVHTSLNRQAIKWDRRRIRRVSECFLATECFAASSCSKRRANPPSKFGSWKLRKIAHCYGRIALFVEKAFLTLRFWTVYYRIWNVTGFRRARCNLPCEIYRALWPFRRLSVSQLDWPQARESHTRIGWRT